MAARICLNMIVKNEAPIIERCLRSVLPHVDHYVICDTGSQDGTADIIRACGDQHGMSGIIAQTPFIDFASARNRALQICRASSLSFDYILLMDADMEFMTAGPELPWRLSADAYSLLQRNDRMSYFNTRLIRRDVPAKYVGVTHEYLEVSASSLPFHQAWFFDHACGSSRSEKTTRDLKLLLGGLAQEPENSRYHFYLAQTYKDDGQFAEAIVWYTRRIQAGGWAEEVWYAIYMRALCHLALGNTAQFIEGCLHAYDQRPSRAEPLHALARHYRETGQSEACLMFCEVGQTIPFPVEDQLFVHDHVYRSGFLEEASISGYYCQAPARKALGRAACLRLTVEREVDEKVRRTARRNAFFYATSAQDMFSTCSIRPIDLRVGESERCTNPSICMLNGKPTGVVRVVNYALNGYSYRVLDDSGTIRTTSALVAFDSQWNIVRDRRIIDRTLTSEHPLGVVEPDGAPGHNASTSKTLPRFDTDIRGFEDCRLFEWRSRPWCVACARDTNPDRRAELVVLALDDEGDVVRAYVNRAIHPDQHQKNWMPLVSDDNLYLIYSSDPTTIVRFELDASGDDASAFTVVDTLLPNFALDHCRGGTQAVEILNGFLCLVHETIEGMLGSRNYLHRFVRFDHDFRVVAVSDPFFFKKLGVEFASGLVYDAAQRALIVSFGVGDSEAMLAVMDADRVLAALETRQTHKDQQPPHPDPDSKTSRSTPFGREAQDGHSRWDEEYEALHDRNHNGSRRPNRESLPLSSPPVRNGVSVA
ncbi:MAG: glycosyltransferase [Anaerolineae bacterium]